MPVKFKCLVQSKCNQCVTKAVVVPVSAASRDHDILLTGICSLEGHRRCKPTGGQLRRPKLLTGVLIKGAKPAVICSRNKKHTASSNDRTSYVWGSCRWDSFGQQLVLHSQCRLPTKVASV